jgi:hypothetical protein
MFNAFLEPCSHSGIRTNEERVIAAVALCGTILQASPKVTDYSIRCQTVAALSSEPLEVVGEPNVALLSDLLANRSSATAVSARGFQG